MRLRYLEVENTVNFCFGTYEIKNFLVFNLYHDQYMSLLLLICQCIIQLFDVESPTKVFGRQSMVLVMSFLSVTLFLGSRDNLYRLKVCDGQDKITYLSIFTRYYLLKSYV